MALTQSVGGEDHPASDFAYVPDPDKPSTWKLPIFDARHTAAAVAAIGKGFRGKKVAIPASDMAAVKAKVKAAYTKFFPDNDVPPVLKAANINFDLDDAPVSMVAGLLNLFAQYAPWGTTYSEVVGDTEADDGDDGDGNTNLDGDIPVMKSKNKELRQATYVVLQPDTVDLQGDTYDAASVSKACHNFWSFCQKAYIDHAEETQSASIVENYILPTAMIIGKTKVAKGAWIQVWQFDEALWAEVKKGKYTGVSIGAYAKTEVL